MCGIVGILEAWPARGAEGLGALADGMANCLDHRGPDDSGTWVDAGAGVAFGHRRLAIIDLSPEGRQPMLSADGRYVLTYNGEVYNFADLRKQLEGLGHGFRGHSDTEVLVEAVAEWGIEGAVARANGMFAFAVWDRADRVLTLARDRIGEKPLYYGTVDGDFVFGSELKAIRRHPDFAAEIDRNALARFLVHNYIPAPDSVYRGIKKLRPGCLLTVRPGREPTERPYWSAREVVEAAVNEPIPAGEAVDRLEAQLREAVRIRMVADVPIGAFLSGGIDSSTVVALMQAESTRPVRTFTIGFHEAGYDEAAHAGEVADHLGTDHTELYVTPAEAREVIPRIPEIWDEPFADSSQIPTYLVARMTRNHVAVALSGDGGDELFMGYDRYRYLRRLLRARRTLPGPVRRGAAGLIERRSPQRWTRSIRRFERVLPGSIANPRFGDRLHTVARLLASASAVDLYAALVTHWQDPLDVVVGATGVRNTLTDPTLRANLDTVDEQVAYLDLVTYLPDDILVKVDRATMAASLESRIPMLDPGVVELAWRIPRSLKIRRGTGKWCLREVLHRHVPAELVERPKMGFGVPIDAWLRGPLREWAGDLLSEDRIRHDGYLKPEPVREAWNRHLSGAGAQHYPLWDVLMFQAWLDAQP